VFVRRERNRSAAHPLDQLDVAEGTGDPQPPAAVGRPLAQLGSQAVVPVRDRAQREDTEVGSQTVQRSQRGRMPLARIDESHEGDVGFGGRPRVDRCGRFDRQRDDRGCCAGQKPLQ